MSKLITIQESEYVSLKKKAAIADDLLVQMDQSANDIASGRISKFKH